MVAPETVVQRLFSAALDLAAPAIDRAHLSLMTLGEPSLEREVLALFVRQVELLLPRIREAAPAAAATLAHTLRGSALGIGAFRVAHAAEAVEQTAPAAVAADLAAAIDALDAAIAESRMEIAALLRMPEQTAAA